MPGPVKGELTPLHDPNSFAYNVPDGAIWEELAARAQGSLTGSRAELVAFGSEPLDFQWRGIAAEYRLRPGDRCVTRLADEKYERDTIGCSSEDERVMTVVDGRRALLVVRGFEGTPQEIADTVLEPDFPLEQMGSDRGGVFGRIGTELSPMRWWYRKETLYLLGLLERPGPAHHEPRWIPRR